MSTDTYNGWSNYQTWAVKLWLDNDEPTQHYWEEQARKAIREPIASDHLTRRENATRSLEAQLKEQINEATPDIGASMYSDLLSTALDEVNYREIAEAFLEVLDELDEEDDEEFLEVLDELDEEDDEE